MRSPYEHFLNRSQRLEESRFWVWMTSRRSQPDWQRVRAGDWLAHDGLNIDELEAFCLNLRMLIQPRDGISIRDMCKLSSGWPPAYASQISVISSANDELEKRLKEPSLVALWSLDETTNHDLFEVMFYGGLVHANLEKRNEFEMICQSGLFSAFAFQAFCTVLLHYRNCIVLVAQAVVSYVAAEEELSAAWSNPSLKPVSLGNR